MFVLFFVFHCDLKDVDFYEELSRIQIFEHRKGGEYLDLKRRKCLENEEHL
jgi:hypothetical protein